jgi:hypothetical protein
LAAPASSVLFTDAEKNESLRRAGVEPLHPLVRAAVEHRERRHPGAHIGGQPAIGITAGTGGRTVAGFCHHVAAAGVGEAAAGGAGGAGDGLAGLPCPVRPDYRIDDHTQNGGSPYALMLEINSCILECDSKACKNSALVSPP